jgi:hypothetical protein
MGRSPKAVAAITRRVNESRSQSSTRELIAVNLKIRKLKPQKHKGQDSRFSRFGRIIQVNTV